MGRCLESGVLDVAGGISLKYLYGGKHQRLHVQSVGENKLSEDNGCTLKVHSLPTVVFQSFDVE